MNLKRELLYPIFCKYQEKKEDKLEKSFFYRAILVPPILDGKYLLHRHWKFFSFVVGFVPNVFIKESD